jgi:hypothetical protein
MPVTKLLSLEARNSTAEAIFIRIPYAAHRHLFHNLSAKLLLLFCGKAHFAESGRSNRAGADGVDANFAFLEIDGPSARKRTHGGFCCGINAHRLHALGACDGGVQNNGTAVLSSAATLSAP